MNPLHHISSYKIILGSGSPRRRELFDIFELPYEVITSDVEEIIPEGMAAAAAPVYLSELKANDLKGKLTGDFLLITADTVVISQERVLGKPKDAAEAQQMVKELQGAKHTVVTGVSVTTADRQESFSDTTVVTMPPMTEEEISWHVDHSPVMDKAGAYGIQDWIGLTKVAHLDGSYYNVMGLPTHLLYQHLRDWR